MNFGRPVFTQEDPDQALPDEDLDASQEPTGSGETRPPVDTVGNKLKFSTTWQTSPCFEGQAQLYPDSVKVVDERYAVFDMNSKSDMDRYSEIKLSSSRRDKYLITSEEREQWSEAKGSWLVSFRYQERMFKSYLTSHQVPSDK